jgi:hypothetical protein
MALSDELNKLEDLRQRGVLTDEEFSRAKTRLLDEPCGLANAPLVAGFNALRRSRSDRGSPACAVASLALLVWSLGYGAFCSPFSSFAVALVCCSTACCGFSCRPSD